MKKVCTILLFWALSFSLSYASGTGTLSSTGASDESKSIKELHDNIKNLKVEKRDLSEKWVRFNKENGKITDFIKTDLSSEDIKDIEDSLNTYYASQEDLEKNLKTKALKLEDTQGVKNDLVQLKLDLYKVLTPYIRVEKLKEYLVYIKSNIEIVKEDKQIKDDIYRKEEILGKKVDAIKVKIEANNRLLDEKISQLLREKITEKINNLLQNPKFIALEKDKKKAVFQATLEKITQKKESLKNIHDQTTLVEKKVEMYSIVEEKLKEVISQY